MELVAWRSIAEALGFRLSAVSEGSMYGWSFASFRRELREPAMTEQKLVPWAHGLVDGALVIVRPAFFYDFTTEGAVQRVIDPPAGSGLERYPPPPPLHTMVMAEIDPPLFSGLKMVTKPSARFGHPEAAQLFSLSDARLGRRYWTIAHDRARVDAVFAPATDLDPLVGAMLDVPPGTGIALHDGVVEVFATAAPSVLAVKVLAQRAAVIARAVSARAAALPPRASDDPLRDEWSRAASARGLAFDPRRFQISGAIRGIELEALVETGHGGLATSVRVKLRRALGCGLSLRRAFETEQPGVLNFVWKIPGNVTIGDRAFDRAFVVDALSRDAAREALSRPGVSSALVALHDVALQVLVHDEEVFAADDGCRGAAELLALLDRAVAAADALSPSLGAGAYR